MGIRSLTHIKNDGKTICTIYRQYDGDPSGLGRDIKDLFQGFTIVNGFSGNGEKQANGMGCFAAQLIKGLKDGIGNVYIYPPDSSDCWEEFTYTLSEKDGRLWLTLCDGSQLFDGFLDDFNPDAFE